MILVEKVAFTGGPETARHIVKNSAENLSQVSLELGGKSPVVVFNDAEQENALKWNYCWNFWSKWSKLYCRIKTLYSIRYL